jgi:hypothetical protein
LTLRAAAKVNPESNNFGRLRTLAYNTLVAESVEQSIAGCGRS